jgi:hypothetical protein
VFINIWTVFFCESWKQTEEVLVEDDEDEDDDEDDEDDDDVEGKSLLWLISSIHFLLACIA